jgi:hypothetical protein
MDEPKPPAWTNLSTSISAIAGLLTVVIIFAFLISCMNLYNIETALGFTATEYLDFIDYVQSVPIYIGTVAGGLAFPLVTYALLLAVGIYGILTPMWQPKHASLFLRSVNIALGLICLSYIGVIYFLQKQTRDTLKQDILKMKPSTVFRRGEPPIKGALFLHSGRYIFLWISDDNSVVAIPNVEVQMIQTPSNQPLPRGTPTPINPSPTTTAAPSPTSSTPK